MLTPAETGEPLSKHFLKPEAAGSQHSLWPSPAQLCVHKTAWGWVHEEVRTPVPDLKGFTVKLAKQKIGLYKVTPTAKLSILSIQGAAVSWQSLFFCRNFRSMETYCIAKVRREEDSNYCQLWHLQHLLFITHLHSGVIQWLLWLAISIAVSVDHCPSWISRNHIHQKHNLSRTWLVFQSQKAGISKKKWQHYLWRKVGCLWGQWKMVFIVTIKRISSVAQVGFKTVGICNFDHL